MEVIEVVREDYEHLGLKGRLLRVNPNSLAVASVDFYVRRELDQAQVERLKRALQEGAELPPAVVGYVKELSGYRLIDGNHTAKAHQELGLSLLVVDIGELPLVTADALQVRLNPPEKLALSVEDLKEFARRRFSSYAELGLTRRDRREVVSLIAKVVNRSERTVYVWLSDLIEEEERKKKQAAVELLKEGRKVEEVAKDLGVSDRTVVRWQRQEEEKRSSAIAVGSEVFWQVMEEYYERRDGKEIGFEGFESYCKRHGYKLQEEWADFKREVFDLMVREFLRGREREERRRRVEKALLSKGFPRRVASKVAEDFFSLYCVKIEAEIGRLEGLIRQAWEDLPEDLDRYLFAKHGGVFYRRYKELFHALLEEQIRAYREALREEDEEEEEESLGELQEVEREDEAEEEDEEKKNLKGIGHKGFLRVLASLSKDLKTLEELLQELSKMVEGEVLQKVIKGQKVIQRSLSLLKTASEQAQVSLEKKEEKKTAYYSISVKAISAINHAWNYYFKKPLIVSSNYGSYVKLLDKAIRALAEREKVEEDLERRFINALLVVLSFSVHWKTSSVAYLLEHFLERLDEARESLSAGRDFYSRLRGRKLRAEEFSQEVQDLVQSFWGQNRHELEELRA